MTAAPETPEQPPAKKKRNWWVWISAGLAVVAIGLLVWALSIRSDLETTQDDVAELQTQVDAGQEAGGAFATAAKALYDDLAAQLGATTDDLDAAQDAVDTAQDTAEQAQQAAADAQEVAESATDATDKAEAEADQAKAELEAAESKATIVAECAKAYVGAFGGLLDGDAAAVREQVSGITDQCRTALEESSAG